MIALVKKEEKTQALLSAMHQSTRPQKVVDRGPPDSTEGELGFSGEDENTGRPEIPD